MKIFKMPFMGHQLTIKVLAPSQMSEPGLLGEFIRDQYEINLVNTLPVKLRRAVLSHELFHAFVAFSGFKYIIETIHPEFEEGMVSAFEVAMGNMIYYTPKIEAWLLGE